MDNEEIKDGSSDSALFSSRSSYVLVFCTSIILYIVSQRAQITDIILYLGVKDTDDAMRLLSVRSLLGGQSWFDMTQYRVLPPEGISLHWSRYLDAPLAGLLWVFSTIMKPALAERIVAALWPLGLFVAYLALVGSTARRVFGMQAACYAILAAGLAPSLGWFGAGRVDHHNVQILAMLAVVSALILAERSWVFGAVAGAIAALSLAIGLETVPLIAAVALVLTVKYIVGAAESRKQLAAFGLSLGFFAPVLFVGQTSPAHWFVSTCDSLSMPWLTLTSAAAASCLLWCAAGRLLGSWQMRTALVAVTSLGVGVLVFPELKDCVAGPYASLPERQKDVIGTIIEALPFYRVLFNAPAFALALIGPLAAAVCLMTFCLVRRGEGEAIPVDRWVLGILSIAPWCGLLLSQVQIRAALIGWAALPVVSGFLILRLADNVKTSSSILKTAQNVGLGALLAAQTWFLAGMLVSPATDLQMSDGGCLHPSQVAALNALRPARVLAPMNFGPHVLLHTDHVVFSAPYHRSAPAMINGTAPFAGDESTMLGTVVQYSPDYIIVCRDQIYMGERSIGTTLARGEGRVWLERVDLRETSLVVWRVLHEEVNRISRDRAASF